MQSVCVEIIPIFAVQNAFVVIWRKRVCYVYESVDAFAFVVVGIFEKACAINVYCLDAAIFYARSCCIPYMAWETVALLTVQPTIVQWGVNILNNIACNCTSFHIQWFILPFETRITTAALTVRKIRRNCVWNTPTSSLASPRVESYVQWLDDTSEPNKLKVELTIAAHLIIIKTSRIF